MPIATATDRSPWAGEAPAVRCTNEARARGSDTPTSYGQLRLTGMLARGDRRHRHATFDLHARPHARQSGWRSCGETKGILEMGPPPSPPSWNAALVAPHGPFRGPFRRCADLRVRAYAYILGVGAKPVCAVVRVRARGKPIWGSGGRRFKSCLPDHFFNLGSTSSAPTARRWSHSRSAPRAASIRSAARRRFSSKTSVYVLSVIRTSECPTISMSAQGESPCAWRSEAAVCRSSLMPRAGQAPDDI